MRTITEDYVSFETAKLLSKKNFDYTAEYESYYTLGGAIVYFKDNPQDINIAPRITLQMAMKWLREVYNIYISIQPDFPSDKDYKMYWCWSVSILYENCISTKGYQCYIDSFEEACEAAIKYCLENLI